MAVINRIAEFHEEIKGWRRDLHAHPETAFEEQRTSDFVAGKLAEFGIEVHRGLATTGVVGLLDGRSNASGRAIGLRADMDALHIQELNDFDHRSRHDGKMHACGHDGHTAMLLGAAKYLSETRNFDGTRRLHLPAGGGKRRRRPGHGRGGPVREVPGAKRSTVCTTCRASPSARWPCAPGRRWRPSTSSRSPLPARAPMAPCRTRASIR